MEPDIAVRVDVRETRHRAGRSGEQHRVDHDLVAGEGGEVLQAGVVQLDEQLPEGDVVSAGVLDTGDHAVLAEPEQQVVRELMPDADRVYL
ncbi:hypothetical protein BJY22_007246 [Kribbella shirazensis]|uniref:Uncharacterized protein n=1 Tax=Kribbella shirazensis TaxID=1105143 RepID=A0A7X5VI75_9ACTN|nr:hypothetical protein [Kribbella shirazensis]